MINSFGLQKMSQSSSVFQLNYGLYSLQDAVIMDPNGFYIGTTIHN